MTLRMKIWAGVCTFAIYLVVVLAFLTVRGNRIFDHGFAAMGQQAESLAVSARWAGAVENYLTRVAVEVQTPDASVSAQLRSEARSQEEKIAQWLEAVTALADHAPEREALKQLQQMQAALAESIQLARAHREGGDFSSALSEVRQKLQPLAQRYVQAAQAYAASQLQAYQQEQAELETRRQENGDLSRLLVGSIIVGLFIAAWYLVRVIRAPLGDAIACAGQIALGELGQPIPTERIDEFGDLMRALDTMRLQLGRIVAQVRTATEGMTHVSSEIASGNLDLSNRTETTAASLQQTSESVTQLATLVQQSAQSAAAADRLAADTVLVAGRGGTVVGQVVETMESITQASRKIYDIIGVIDGISFQTNILALNAAVEASRAGDQGRGFAVVAAEVRNLAGRSAQAAKEIKDLITTSVARVESGRSLVAQAGANMQDIVVRIERVSVVVNEISASATDQADGTVRLSKTLSELDQMTQQNAALVEESAAAASSMREQAASMASLVSAFKLEPARVRAPHGLA